MLKNSSQKVLPQVDNFLIMEENLMSQFETFSKNTDQFDKTLFPTQEALKCYLEKSNLPIVEVERYGCKYLSLSTNTVDNICDWIVESRSQIQQNSFLFN